MEIDCARDFMEVLIQQGQGRNSMFTTVLSSHQKRTAKRLLLSLRLRQKKKQKKERKENQMIAQVLDGRDNFFSLPRGDNTQFE